MKFFRSIMLLFLMLTLAACSNARYSTKKGNYLKNSKTLPHIVVPANAVAPVQKPYYVVPDASVRASSVKPSMKPPGLE